MNPFDMMKFNWFVLDIAQKEEASVTFYSRITQYRLRNNKCTSMKDGSLSGLDISKDIFGINLN